MDETYWLTQDELTLNKAYRVFRVFKYSEILSLCWTWVAKAGRGCLERRLCAAVSHVYDTRRGGNLKMIGYLCVADRLDEKLSYLEMMGVRVRSRRRNQKGVVRRVLKRKELKSLEKRVGITEAGTRMYR